MNPRGGSRDLNYSPRLTPFPIDFFNYLTDTSNNRMVKKSPNRKH